MGKNQFKKMSLNEFQADANFGDSWADDVDELTFLPGAGQFYAPPKETVRQEVVVPVPDSPPFTARLNNLDYGVDEAALKELIPESDYSVISYRAPKDFNTGRSRGYAFVEFRTRESLVKALELNGVSFMGRNVNISVSDGRGYRGGAAQQDPFDDRATGDWRSERKGPLKPLDDAEFGPRRSGPPRRQFEEERNFDNWERRGPLPPLEGARGERRGPRPPRVEDQRDFDNWEKRGPLPSAREGNFRPARGPDHPRREEPELDWGSKRTLSPRRGASGGAERGFHAHKPREPREPREPDTPADSAGTWRSSKPGLGVAHRNIDVKTRTVSSDSTGGSSLFGEAHPVNTAQREEEMSQKNREREMKVLQHAKNRTKKSGVEGVRRGFDILSVNDDKEEAEEPSAAKEHVQEAPGSSEVVADAVSEETDKSAKSSANAGAEDVGSWETVKRK